MKKSTLTLAALTSLITLHAQLSIGKHSVEGDGMLDFAPGINKGIILPNVSIIPTENLVGGTLLFNGITNVIQYYNGTAWKNLSDLGHPNVFYNAGSDIAVNGVVLGSSSTTTASGILILESQTKALILPKIYMPEQSIKSPVAGTICYDTYRKALAVFDGINWMYWN